MAARAMISSPFAFSLMRFLGSLSIAVGLTALTPNSASAVLSYSTSFSDTDSPAFADGTINNQNGWSVTNNGHYLIDADGAGIVGRTNANGPVHTGSATDVTSALAAGETITMTLSLNFVGSFANQNSGAWLLGIGANAAGMTEGGSQNVGSATFFNNGGANFFTSAIGFGNSTKNDTGVPWDSAYHTLTTTVTRSSTVINTFDVTTDLDGNSNSFTVLNADLWSGASTAYAGFRWRGNQDGNVDAFSVSDGMTAVPEASQLTVFATLSAGLVAFRRRWGD